MSVSASDTAPHPVITVPPAASASVDATPAAMTALSSPGAQNANPLLVDASVNDDLPPLEDEELDALRDEIYSLIRNIHDPEHPHSLEQLGVVYKSGLSVRKEYPSSNCAAANNTEAATSTAAAPAVPSGNSSSLIASAHELVDVEFRPTVPHCSLATLIGLCIRTKVKMAIPHCKLSIHIKPGSHQTAEQIEKQLNDKERATAAMENPALRETVEKLIKDERAYE